MPTATAEEIRERVRTIAPILAENAPSCVEARRVIAASRNAMVHAGLFRIPQPSRVDGYELPLPVLGETVTAVSEACPSSGWVLMVMAAHHFCLGTFPEQAQEDVFGGGRDSLVAGTLSWQGQAQKVDGGYRVDGRWEHRLPHARLEVVELMSLTREAYLGLWRYCCEVDLVREVSARMRSVDEPLPWLLENPRAALANSQRSDMLWLRPLDTPRFLAARRYLTEDQVILQIEDPLGMAGGRFVVEGGPQGATCRQTDAAALAEARHDAAGEPVTGDAVHRPDQGVAVGCEGEGAVDPPLDPRPLEGEHLMGGGDPGSAICPDQDVIPDPGRLERAAQRAWVLEASAPVHVLRRGPVPSSRNVAADAVDRLDHPPEALIGSGVEEHAGACELCGLVRAEPPGVAAAGGQRIQHRAAMRIECPLWRPCGAGGKAQGTPFARPAPAR